MGPITVVDGILNGNSYIDLLRELVIPEMEASQTPIIFQIDNARRTNLAKILEKLLNSSGLRRAQNSRLLSGSGKF